MRDDDKRSCLSRDRAVALAVMICLALGGTAVLCHVDKMSGLVSFAYRSVPGCTLREMNEILSELACHADPWRGHEYARALEYGPAADIWGNATAWSCTNQTVHSTCLAKGLCDASSSSYPVRRPADLTCILLQQRPASYTLYDCVGRGRIGCDDVAVRALGLAPPAFAWPADVACGTSEPPRVDRLLSRVLGRRLRCVDDRNATVTCSAVDSQHTAWRVVSRRTK